MKHKVEYVHYSPSFGPWVMEATTWAEAISELHEKGYVNCGEQKIVRRTYQWISDEPQLIDTDYK